MTSTVPATGLVIWLLRMRSVTCAICAADDGDLRGCGLALRAGCVHLLGVRANLTVLRFDLLLLRLDLLLEHTRVPLGLIELLRGCGLLRVEALRALVGATGDVPLCFERGALCLGGISLCHRDISLGLQDVDLLSDLVDSR